MEKYVSTTNNSKIYFFRFECPACNKGFITHYNYTNERKIKNDISYNMLKLVNSYPKVPELHQLKNQDTKRIK